MAKDSLLGRLRDIIGDMVDDNRHVKALPGGKLGKMNLPNNKIKFLADLIVLLRDTNIITEETKIYIFNKYMTKRGVNEIIRETSGKEVPFNNTASKIQYDHAKLQKLFGENLIYDVLSKTRNIESYESILDSQYMKYSNSSEIRDKLIINIPNNCMQREITEEQFQDFVEVILPYIKNQVKFIEDNIDREACGYFNYIISSPNLTDEDKERLNRLKMLLGITTSINK